MELPGSSVSPPRCQSHVLRFLRMMVVLKEVATALAYMHSNEITHNDMKWLGPLMSIMYRTAKVCAHIYIYTHIYIYYTYIHIYILYTFTYIYIYIHMLFKKVLALYPRIMNPDHLVGSKRLCIPVLSAGTWKARTCKHWILWIF